MWASVLKTNLNWSKDEMNVTYDLFTGCDNLSSFIIITWLSWLPIMCISWCHFSCIFMECGTLNYIPRKTYSIGICGFVCALYPLCFSWRPDKSNCLKKKWLYYCVTYCNGNICNESHLCTEMHWRHECHRDSGTDSANIGIGPQHLRCWQQKTHWNHKECWPGNLFVEANSQHWLIYSQQDTESAWLTVQDPRGSPGSQPYQGHH